MLAPVHQTCAANVSTSPNSLKTWAWVDQKSTIKSTGSSNQRNKAKIHICSWLTKIRNISKWRKDGVMIYPATEGKPINRTNVAPRRKIFAEKVARIEHQLTNGRELKNINKQQWWGWNSLLYLHQWKRTFLLPTWKSKGCSLCSNRTLTS